MLLSFSVITHFSLFQKRIIMTGIVIIIVIIIMIVMIIDYWCSSLQVWQPQ